MVVFGTIARVSFPSTSASPTSSKKRLIRGDQDWAALIVQERWVCRDYCPPIWHDFCGWTGHISHDVQSFPSPDHEKGNREARENSAIETQGASRGLREQVGGRRCGSLRGRHPWTEEEAGHHRSLVRRVAPDARRIIANQRLNRDKCRRHELPSTPGSQLRPILRDRWRCPQALSELYRR